MLLATTAQGNCTLYNPDGVSKKKTEQEQLTGTSTLPFKQAAMKEAQLVDEKAMLPPETAFDKDVAGEERKTSQVPAGINLISYQTANFGANG